MGLVGGAAGALCRRLLAPIHERAALFAAGWIAVNASALVLAVVLGVQPALAHTADGKPLFFPFGLSVTIPALMIPHALIGVGEGLLTVAVCGLFAKIGGKRVP
jgi:cobalt/nickel transport system permease protein